MTHVRTQIRETLADALTTVLPDFDVHASFKYARNVTDRPMIDMRFLNENVGSDTMGSARRRVASLYLRVQRPGTEAAIDDLLDIDEIAVNAVVMEGQWWVDLLEQEPELMQVNWSDSDEGGRIIGTIVLRYDVEYRVTQTNLEDTI